MGIYDTEKLIVNIPGKTFSLNVKAGDPLQEGDIITDAIRQNKKKVSMKEGVRHEQGRFRGGCGGVERIPFGH